MPDLKPSLETIELPTVTSDGRTGQELLESLRDEDVLISHYAEGVLTQDEFNEEHITDGVRYELTAIPASAFSEIDSTNKNARQVGVDECHLSRLRAEAIALLAEELTADSFKHFIKEFSTHDLFGIHEPLISTSGMVWLCLSELGGALGLDARYGTPETNWGPGTGFVFRSHDPDS